MNFCYERNKLSYLLLNYNVSSVFFSYFTSFSPSHPLTTLYHLIHHLHRSDFFGQQHSAGTRSSGSVL